MSIVTVNGFTLEPEIVLIGKRPCRIFTPPVVDKDHLKIYWVQYLDDGSIGACSEEEIVKLKNGKVLYGK